MGWTELCQQVIQEIKWAHTGRDRISMVWTEYDVQFKVKAEDKETSSLHNAKPINVW